MDEKCLDDYFESYVNDIREYDELAPLCPQDQFWTGQPWALNFRELDNMYDSPTLLHVLEDGAGAYDAGQPQAILDDSGTPSQDRRAITWCNADFIFGEVGLTWVDDDDSCGAYASSEDSAAAIVVHLPSAIHLLGS